MTFDLSPLYEAFSFLRELTGEEREALASVVQLRTLRRHQYILQAGDVCRHYTFVLKGCMSLYYIDRSGKEHALMFAVEQEWIRDLGSCHHRVPSQLFLEALEPTTILQVPISELWRLWNRYHIFDRYFRVITEDSFATLQQRLLLTFSATAREKYETFARDYPHLVARIPARWIASYLGITPESLSRAKREILESARTKRGK